MEDTSYSRPVLPVVIVTVESRDLAMSRCRLRNEEKEEHVAFESLGGR